MPEKKTKAPRPPPTDSANSTPKLKRAKTINSASPSKSLSPKSVSERSISKQVYSHPSHDDLDDNDWLTEAGIHLVDPPTNQLFAASHENFHFAHLRQSHFASPDSVIDIDLGSFHDGCFVAQSNDVFHSNYSLSNFLHDYELVWLSELELHQKQFLHTAHESQLSLPISSTDSRDGSIISHTTAETSDPDFESFSILDKTISPTERVTGKPLSMVKQLQNAVTQPKESVVQAPSTQPVVRKRGRPRRIPAVANETAVSSVSLPVSKSVDLPTSSPPSSVASIHVWDDEDVMGGFLEAFA